MNKISIIGCGWLGFSLGVFLVEKGFEVLGSTTTLEKLALLKNANISPFLIKAEEQLDGENLNDFFNTDILIVNIPPRRRRPNVEAIHFKEVKNILDFAVKAKVPKVIFCSSTGVYSNTNKVVDENDTPVPQTASSKAVFQIENCLQSISTYKSTILRFSGLVGGDRKAGRFLAGKKDLPNGDAPVNLVHRKDCIQVIYEIIRQDVWGEIFNVCADEHPLRKDFYSNQAIQQGFEAPMFLENAEATFKIVSNKKMKEKLNYQFLYPDPDKFPN